MLYGLTQRLIRSGQPENNLIGVSRGGSIQPLRGPMTVNDHTALTIGTADRCVSVIADTIAATPLQAVRGNRVIDTPAVLRQPERDRSPIDTWTSVLTCVIMRGNAYLVVAGRDGLGYATSFVHVSPDSVKPDVNARGELVYRIGQAVLSPDDVLHVRGKVPAGELCGRGVLDYHRQTLARTLAAEDYAAELWTDGAVPDGLLSSDAALTPDEAHELKQQFVAGNGGRQRGPAVLPAGLEYKPLSWSNADLEMLESRKWNAVNVCSVFGVPPFLAGVPSGESKTYQNVQQDTQLFVRFTLRGWMTRLEQAVSRMRPNGQTVEFDVKDLMRMDTPERYSTYATGIDKGFLTVDEVREMERRDPLPEIESDESTQDSANRALVAQRLYLSVTNGVIGVDEARDILRTIGMPLGKSRTPDLPPPNLAPALDMEVEDDE